MNEILSCKNLSSVYIASKYSVEVGSLAYCVATLNLHLNSANELTPSAWKHQHFVKSEYPLAKTGLFSIACGLPFLMRKRRQVKWIAIWSITLDLFLVLHHNFFPSIFFYKIFLSNINFGWTRSSRRSSPTLMLLCFLGCFVTDSIHNQFSKHHITFLVCLH